MVAVTRQPTVFKQIVIYLMVLNELNSLGAKGIRSAVNSDGTVGITARQWTGQKWCHLRLQVDTCETEETTRFTCQISI